MDKHLETSQIIVENILPLYFSFRLHQSEVSESGVYYREMSEKAESIMKDIEKLLNERYGKIEENETV